MKLSFEFPDGSDRGLLKRLLVVGIPVVLVVGIAFFWWRPVLQTLSPFAVAFVLAYLLNPAIDWLSGENRENRQVHRAISVLVLFLVVVSIGLAIVAYVVPSVVRESARFAGEVRSIYAPAIKRDLQPRLEAWFSAKELVKNPYLAVDSQDSSVPGWDMLSNASDTETRNGRLVLKAPAGERSFPTLGQNLAGLPAGETCTLITRLGEATVPTGPEQWKLRFTLEESYHQTGPAGRLRSGTTTFDLKPDRTQRFDLPIPPTATTGSMVVLGNAGVRAATLEVNSIQLLRPPPVPLFQARFWTRLYDEYHELLDWSTVGRLLLVGARGAGAVAGGAGGAWTWLSAQVGGLVSVLVYVSLLMVILFYMLLDFSAFKRSLLQLVPAAIRDRFVRVMSEMDRQLGGFIRGQVIVCACVGGLVTVFMLILSVPFALLIGLAAGCFNFIPYLGPAMGIIPALILTALEFFEPDASASWVLVRLLMVAGSFMLVQALDGFIISPKVMASTVDVSPLVVMGALMLGGGIAGVTGMVLAIPAYCALRVLAGELRRDWRQLRQGSTPEKPDPD